MCIPCVLYVTPESFGLGRRHGTPGACPGQCDLLNSPCCEPGTHAFASSGGDECRAPPHWKWRATACRRETSGLLQDAVRQPSFRSHQSTETVAPTDAASSAYPARSVSGSVGHTTRR